MTNFLAILIKISRPRFWLYLAGPYLVGGAAAFHSYESILNWEYLVGFLFFLIPANIFLYGVNDYFDYDTDKFNKRKETTETRAGVGEQKVYKLSLILSFVLMICFGFSLSGIARNLFIIFVFLAFFYSAPPLRFKSKVFWDFTSNVLYILPGFIAYFQFGGTSFPISLFIAGWAWASAMHLFSATVDIEADKKAGITTSAVYLGKRNALWVCFILWSIPPILLTGTSPVFVLSLLYPLTILIVFLKKLYLPSVYRIYPYLNAFLGMILFFVALNI